MRIYVNHSVKEYINCYRNKIFSFAEHVKILNAYTIYDYCKNHVNLQKSSSNMIGYYDNIGRKQSFMQTMHFAGSLQNTMIYCPRNYKSFSDVIKEYYG